MIIEKREDIHLQTHRRVKAVIEGVDRGHVHVRDIEAIEEEDLAVDRGEKTVNWTQLTRKMQDVKLNIETSKRNERKRRREMNMKVSTAPSSTKCRKNCSSKF